LKGRCSPQSRIKRDIFWAATGRSGFDVASSFALGTSIGPFAGALARDLVELGGIQPFYLKCIADLNRLTTPFSVSGRRVWLGRSIGLGSSAFTAFTGIRRIRLLAL
jgi:hypothetical protein